MRCFIYNPQYLRMHTHSLVFVPFALIADGVRGVLTKRQLIGTWKASREEKGSLTYHTFNLEKDGSFSYFRKDDYEPEYYSGTWKVNNLGFITFNVTKASPYTGEVGKYVMFSVYDKDGMSFKIQKTEYKN